jgi:formylmethanofuran dehydrogenase subunit E
VTQSKEISLLIENAVKLHGHLGPFLVMGVRMGEIAGKHLDLDCKNSCKLQTSIRTPLFTPFSCVIDGIQASTGCTVGNQKLRIEKSTKKITAIFKLQGSDKTMKISVNTEIAETLIVKMARGVSVEQLAMEIAEMQEEQLFVIEG